jgi:hypothetical protein
MTNTLPVGTKVLVDGKLGEIGISFTEPRMTGNGTYSGSRVVYSVWVEGIRHTLTAEQFQVA